MVKFKIEVAIPARSEFACLAKAWNKVTVIMIRAMLKRKGVHKALKNHTYRLKSASQEKW